MLKPRVMPCLLLQDSALVKTVKFRSPKYIGDAVNTFRIFNEKEVDEIVLLDISATKNKRAPRFDIISEIASECFMPLTYGGGVTTVSEMEMIFSLGVEKIAINSRAIENISIVSEAAKLFGNQSVIGSIDVKKNWFGKYGVYSKGGSRKAHLDPIQYARMLQDAGAGEIILNSIDNDGMMEGYDLNLVNEVAKNLSIPLIACGGAGSIEHIKQVLKAGASGAAAGSMFVFQGKDLGVLINFPNSKEIESMGS